MSTKAQPVSSAAPAAGAQANGAGAAAILAAGVGAFVLAVLAIVGDQSAAMKSFFIFSKPTGPLSGVTTCTIVVWLAVWAVLHVRWKKKAVALGRINAIAFVLLGLSLLLTFPLIADLF